MQLLKLNGFFVACSWCLVTLHFAFCPAGDLPPDLAGIRQFSQTHADRPRWMLKAEESGVAINALATGGDHSQTFTIRYVSYRDGDRLDVKLIRADGGKPAKRWRSIIDGWYIAYDSPPPGKKAVEGMFAADGARFAGAAMPSGLSAFDGYVAGDLVNLTQIIQHASKVESSPDKIDGHPCLLVKAESQEYGLYQVWFDPATDYYPRKIVVEKTARNYWGKLRLDQWTSAAPRGSRGTPLLQHLTWTMDDAKFDQVEGKWFPLACRITRVHSYSDGNVENTVLQCHRTALELNPDFIAARAFMPELKQGAPLSNQMDMHLPFHWKDGAPAPRVDTKVVDHMDRTAAVLKAELNAAGGGGKR